MESAHETWHETLAHELDEAAAWTEVGNEKPPYLCPAGQTDPSAAHAGQGCDDEEKLDGSLCRLGLCHRF